MIIVPFLKKEGVREITGIFLTHPDKDHLGGLSEVLREFKVKMVFDGLDFDETNNSYKEFLYLVNKRKSAYYRLQKGDRLMLDQGIIDILHPSLPLLSGENHLNENSLVIKILWGKISFLMTGDVEKKGEERLLSLNIDSDVLKVSHHGSQGATSEEFLKKVTPLISIISVGKNNPYGHPSQDVLKRLHSSYNYIYRTDLYGAITVLCDGEKYKVITIKKPKTGGNDNETQTN
ncbi:MAG: ComEC family competence protein [bacterium ADurb.Bin363]|nr:MAG: ComEC family competence protein [bacterium ADurb.Bin363]